MTDYLELVLSYFFANFKGRDARAFTKSPAFSGHPEPTLHIASPEFGDANPATLTPDHMHGGEERFPALQWTDHGVAGGTAAQWLLISEDPDAPLPTPVCHGLYLGIPKDKTNVTNDDFQLDRSEPGKVAGGFYYGSTLRGNVYTPPRPLLNHGIHRYFFDVVALSEPLDPAFVASQPKRDQVAQAIEGKVLAWGRWVGQCERRWE